MEANFKQVEDNRAMVANANSVAQVAACAAQIAAQPDALQISDYSQMPDYSDLTRSQSASEKRKRILRYKVDLAKL